MTVREKNCEEPHLGVVVLFSIHWRSLLVSFLDIYRKIRRLTLCVVYRVVALGKQDDTDEPPSAENLNISKHLLSLCPCFPQQLCDSGYAVTSTTNLRKHLS